MIVSSLFIFMIPSSCPVKIFVKLSFYFSLHSLLTLFGSDVTEQKIII